MSVKILNDNIYYNNIELEPIKYLNSVGVECIEVWVDAVDFNGYYQISNLGRIKYTGKEYIDKIGRRVSKRVRIRIQHLSKEGYLYTVLRREGDNITVRTHRLVAENFIKNKNNKCCVNHINCNKLDNKKINLEWCTVRENSKHWVANDNSQSSNFIGVQKDLKYGYYRTSITIEGTTYRLGIFEDELEAKKAYEKTLNNWMVNKIKPKNKSRGRWSSIHKGISYSKSRNKWLAQLYEKGNSFHIGLFEKEEEAKIARDKILEEYKTTKKPSKKTL